MHAYITTAHTDTHFTVEMFVPILVHDENFFVFILTSVGGENTIIVVVPVTTHQLAIT